MVNWNPLGTIWHPFEGAGSCFLFHGFCWLVHTWWFRVEVLINPRLKECLGRLKLLQDQVRPFTKRTNPFSPEITRCSLSETHLETPPLKDSDGGSEPSTGSHLVNHNPSSLNPIQGIRTKLGQFWSKCPTCPDDWYPPINQSQQLFIHDIKCLVI